MIDIGPQPWTKTTRKIVFTLSFLTPFLYLCASMRGVTHGFAATNRRFMLLIVGLILGVNGVALTFCDGQRSPLSAPTYSPRAIHTAYFDIGLLS